MTIIIIHIHIHTYIYHNYTYTDSLSLAWAGHTFLTVYLMLCVCVYFFSDTRWSQVWERKWLSSIFLDIELIYLLQVNDCFITPQLCLDMSCTHFLNEQQQQGGMVVIGRISITSRVWWWWLFYVFCVPGCPPSLFSAHCPFTISICGIALKSETV